MGLLRWFTANAADTRAPSHPDLGPLSWPGVGVEAASERVRRAVQGLRGWRVAEASGGRLALTRSTRVFRFTDDVTVEIAADGAGGSTVHAASKSRVGSGDLGQNRRNILELWAALKSSGG